MYGFFGNARHAVRLLWRSPSLTATAVSCLGLAIGANTALFSVFNTLVWKPLPARDPHALVRLFTKPPEEARLFRGFSFPEYEDYRGQDDVLAGLAASRGVQASFRTAGTDAMRVFGEAVSDGYFEMLGVRVRLGRTLASGRDGAPSTAPEVVLSNRFWASRFHAAPDVIGRTIWLTGVAYTVVGVAPPGFNGTYTTSIFAADLWLPLGTVPQIDPGSATMFTNRSDRSLNAIGRLRPEVPIARARAALDTVAARLQGAYPETNRGVTLLLFRELDTHPEVYSSRALNLVAILFLGLSGLVLVVACANLANLMLARAAARRREMAVRIALGATRGQLIRQLAAESLVLSLAAGGAGLLVAYAASRAVSSLRLPTDLPIVFDVSLDWRAAGFTLAVTLLAGLACSVGRRTREFGIKRAIGAQAPVLLRQVMVQGLSVVGVGLALGTLGALAVSRLMRGLLVGVTAADPWVFLSALGLLVAIGALASYLPARRASRIDPMVALCQE